MLLRAGTISVAAAALLASCAAPAPRWPAGLADSDATQISALIHHESPKEPIYSHARQPDGTLAVFMGETDQNGHTFVLRRFNGKWKIVDEHVLVY